MTRTAPAGATMCEHPTTPTSNPALDRVNLVHAFEAACMIRSTQPALLDYPTAAAGTVLAELSHEAAADRLAILMGHLLMPASRHVETAGIRHQYRIHRLHVADRRASLNVITMAWQQGRKALLTTAAIGSTAPLAAHRPKLAEAAWRATLLAAGRRRGRSVLGLRLIDTGLAAVLVRGAQMLGVPAALVQKENCILIKVPAVAEQERGLRWVGTPLSAAVSPQ